MPLAAETREKLTQLRQDKEEDEKPRGRGRPKLSEEEKQARREARAKKSEETDEQSDEQRQQIDAMLAMAIGQLADAITIRFDLPPALSDEEKMVLVQGTKPVIYKYLPDILDKIGPELILGCTLWFIYGQRWMAKSTRARSPKTQADRGDNGNGEEPPIQTTFETVP